ncbi:putative zinc finger protein, partial [Operophtera brumata]
AFDDKGPTVFKENSKEAFSCNIWGEPSSKENEFVLPNFIHESYKIADDGVDYADGGDVRGDSKADPCGTKHATLKELRAHKAAAHAAHVSAKTTYSRLLTARAIKKEEKPDELSCAGELYKTTCSRLLTARAIKKEEMPEELSCAANLNIDMKDNLTSSILQVYDPETIEEAKPKLGNLRSLLSKEGKRKRRDFICPTCKVDQVTEPAFTAHLKIHPLECLTCGNKDTAQHVIDPSSGVSHVRQVLRAASQPTAAHQDASRTQGLQVKTLRNIKDTAQHVIDPSSGVSHVRQVLRAASQPTAAHQDASRTQGLQVRTLPNIKDTAQHVIDPSSGVSHVRQVLRAASQPTAAHQDASRTQGLQAQHVIDPSSGVSHVRQVLRAASQPTAAHQDASRTQGLQIHPLECLTCGKFFARRANLQLHIKTHLGLKDYNKDTAQHVIDPSSGVSHVRQVLRAASQPTAAHQDASRTQGLQAQHVIDPSSGVSHVRQVLRAASQPTAAHQDASRTQGLQIHPLECLTCGKFFARRANLQLHIKTHLGLKDYNKDTAQHVIDPSSGVSHVRQVLRAASQPTAAHQDASRTQGLQAQHVIDPSSGVSHVRQVLRAASQPTAAHQDASRTQGLQIHPLECLTCGKFFARRANLQLHIKTHLGLKDYNKDTAQHVIDPSSGVSHVRQVLRAASQPTAAHQDASRTQGLQAQHVIDPSSGVSHVRQVLRAASQPTAAHQDASRTQGLQIHPLECLTCGKFFARRANLQLHIKTHLGLKDYNKDTAQHVIDPSSGVSHVRQVLRAASQPTAAHQDASRTQGLQAQHVIDPSSGVSHVRQVLRAASQPTAAHQDASRTQGLQIHPLECLTCGKFFARRANLQLHIKTHLGLKDYNKDTAQHVIDPSSGVSHVRQVLRAASQPTAAHQDASRTQGLQVTEPAFTAHLKIHPLECLTCGKFFARRANLQLHIKTHLGLKDYKCDICEKRFMTRQKLGEHHNIHTGRAPYKCTFCDDTFRRYSNMSRAKYLWHKETHADKPRACVYCSDKFVHAASLTRHVRRSHNDLYLSQHTRLKNDNVTCPICKQVCTLFTRSRATCAARTTTSTCRSTRGSRTTTSPVLYASRCVPYSLAHAPRAPLAQRPLLVAAHAAQERQRHLSYMQAGVYLIHSLTRHVRRSHNDLYLSQHTRLKNDNVTCPICK